MREYIHRSTWALGAPELGGPGCAVATAIASWLIFALACVVSTAGAQTLEKPKLTIGVGGKSLFYYLPLTIAEQNRVW